MDGLLAKGTVSTPDKISCSDPDPGAVKVAQKKGYRASTSNSDVILHTNDVIVIAVKPDYVVTVCDDIVMEGTPDALIISVAAGVTLATLEAALPNRRVVRVMPNTACLVGESASGYALGSLANAQDKELVKAIFGSVGIALEQDKEDLLNAVTGLCTWILTMEFLIWPRIGFVIY
jgi:pyrroline-5-carboxylate reductase